MPTPVKEQAAPVSRQHPLPPILSEDVIPFTECRNNLAEYMAKTRRTHRPIIVTQNGRPTIVVVGIEDWESVESDWDFLESVQRGLVQAQCGKLTPHDEAVRMINGM